MADQILVRVTRQDGATEIYTSGDADVELTELVREATSFIRTRGFQSLLIKIVPKEDNHG